MYGRPEPQAVAQPASDVAMTTQGSRDHSCKAGIYCFALPGILCTEPPLPFLILCDGYIALGALVPFINLTACTGQSGELA